MKIKPKPTQVKIYFDMTVPIPKAYREYFNINPLTRQKMVAIWEIKGSNSALIKFKQNEEVVKNECR
jgi:hypothetical protein